MPTLREWMREAPFALGMSSGFFGFFAHAGVMSVLEEQELLPNRVGGASAGALVAGTWASGVSAAHLSQELLGLERAHFWDPRPGAGLLAGQLFRERLESILRVSEIDRCRVPVSVSVYDVLARRVRVIDRGPLAVALHASCAVPLLFHPVVHEGRLLIDGGVADRPGLTGLRDAPRVLFHHLASRSPWRGKDSEALRIPRRQGLVTLVIEELPRVGPFRLREGRRAFEHARRAAARALDQPIVGGEVRL